jgi:STE24 endopeptidase
MALGNLIIIILAFYLLVIVVHVFKQRVLKKTNQDITSISTSYSNFTALQITLLFPFIAALLMIDMNCAIMPLIPNQSFRFWITILIKVILLVGLLAIILLPAYKAQKQIRGITISKRRYIWLTTVGWLFVFIPIIIWAGVVTISINVLPSETKTVIIFGIILLLCYVFLLHTYYPRLLGLIYGMETLKDETIKSRLTELLKRTNLEIKGIYVVKTKDIKMANAWVIGLFGKRIYITDYLLGNFTLDETETVLAHELGHLKKRDLWLGLGFSLGFLIFWTMYRYSLLSSAWGISSFGMFALLFLNYFFLFVSRKREFKADKYVIQVASNPSAFIEALRKLALLNTESSHQEKAEEFFATHPSIERRILKFTEALNLTREQAGA